MAVGIIKNELHNYSPKKLPAEKKEIKKPKKLKNRGCVHSIAPRGVHPF